MKRAFSVSARRALSSPGRRRSHLPSQRTPKPPREDPATRTTDPEATRPWGAGAGVPRVCRKSFHKSHLGTCVTLTCSHSPGPGEPRSPASSESVPAKPSHAAQPSLGLAFPRLRSPVGAAAAAAAAASADGPVGVSALALAQTSGRGTAAGRELRPAGAAALPPGCCSAARRRPLLGPWAGTSRDAASQPRGDTSAFCVLHPRLASLSRGPSRPLGSRRRTSPVGYNFACESIATSCLPFLTSNGAHNIPLRQRFFKRNEFDEAKLRWLPNY
ncbi:uncharacterized protein LOC125918869 [Panthera uncia]|uniref:uncharacterized protein LOC125918869 n=1 Tax=Panthera uncia TaxID=29064 RepID=UPI0020FFB844|nr:uncharacterized protein LOC125918869 [Panthera uncia]XP_049481091.1 uncharacterized protein LOC125918869 [Panthera uncia]